MTSNVEWLGSSLMHRTSPNTQYEIWSHLVSAFLAITQITASLLDSHKTKGCQKVAMQHLRWFDLFLTKYEKYREIYIIPDACWTSRTTVFPPHFSIYSSLIRTSFLLMWRICQTDLVSSPRSWYPLARVVCLSRTVSSGPCLPIFGLYLRFAKCA
jgi:hypothetical protein